VIFKKFYLYILLRQARARAGLIFLPVFIFLVFENSIAQDRCGTVEYTQKLKSLNLFRENETTFENWLQKNKSKRKGISPFRTKATYQVPVVVHVIHNGEAVGIGTNISEAQILSQIAVLNKDYQRLNTDASNTPAEFLPVAGSFDVEFILAKRTPEGLATTGIVRKQGTKNSYTVNDNYELKSISYWPAEDYLNLWVCNIIDYLGYAQFPVSSLAGLENSSNNRLTDGVVIAYQAFGSADDGSFNLEPDYNKGRTATHEIGHFFGLRHTWGDDDGTCSGTDYVDDTPNQANFTKGCPTHPSTSCSVVKMFQNYLDYTDDRCMNIFTQGQVSRMQTVIENSPRRESLLTSPALLDPIPVANDLGIKQIIAPALNECNTLLTPVIEIRNYGNNTITSAQIQIKKDGAIVETISPPLSLAPLTSTTISFTNLSLSSGSHMVTFTILQTNGVSDGNPADNVADQTTQVPFTQTTPFTQLFNSFPVTWTIQNPDQNRTWENVTAANASSSNKAMKMDFYDYEDGEGEIDLIVTPTIDLSASTVALLSFDIAHARYGSSSNDGLRILVVTDCNSDLTQATKIYEKKGASLSTTASTTIGFTPTNASQWRTETVNLNAFVGQSNVQLAFIGLNDWGNNLYLDNISVNTTAVEEIALSEIVSPSPVTCLKTSQPVVRVKNNGTVTINSLTVNYRVNGGTQQATQITGINLGLGESTDITLPAVTFAQAVNTLTVEVKSPNGVTDLNPNDNTRTASIIINEATESMPARENFDGDFTNRWTVANAKGGMDFQPTATNYNTSLYFNAFDNTTIDDEGWLVSPIFDFSSIAVKQISFDLSYRFNPGMNDRLRVLASTDCGYSYPVQLFDKSGAALSNETSTESWTPEQDSDWQNLSVDLSSLARKENVRIAFVVTNDNGNNLYLDNIDFFVVTSMFTVYPNPTNKETIYVALNLPDGEPALLEIIDRIGKVVISETINNSQNQIQALSLPGATSGLYFVRLKTSTQTHTEKLLIID
jgi:hypothetical protein